MALPRLACVALALLAALPCAPATSAASDEGAAVAAPGVDLTLADAIALAMRNNRSLISGRLVALELSVPIGDVASKQRLFRARSGVTRAHIDLAEFRQSIDIEVRNAVRNVDARLRQVGLASRASEVAARKLEAERQKLTLGLTTNFRVIVFEDDLVRAQTNELSANITYLNALSSLDQTLGTTLQTWGLEVERVERQSEATQPVVLEDLDDAGSNP